MDNYGFLSNGDPNMHPNFQIGPLNIYAMLLKLLLKLRIKLAVHYYSFYNSMNVLLKCFIGLAALLEYLNI